MKKKSLKFGSVCLSLATLTSAMTAAPLSIADNNVVVQEEHYATGALDPSKEVIDENKVIDTVEEYYEKLDDDTNVYAAKSSAKASSSDATASSQNFPSWVDNSKSKYFPAIGDQGGLGSCVTWAQVYYQYTYAINKARNVAATKSNTYCPEWIFNLLNTGANQAVNSITVCEMLQSQGVVSIADLPTTGQEYKSWHPDENLWIKALDNRLKDYYYIEPYIGDNEEKFIRSATDSNLDVVKASLNDGKLISFTSCSPNAGWNSDTIKVPSKTNGYNVDNSYVGERVITRAHLNKTSMDYHRMTIVGYNDNIWTDINGNGEVDAGEMGALKIANSWTEGWDNNGFCWISYDALNRRSVVTNKEDSYRTTAVSCMLIMEVDNQKINSGIYLKYTLNSSNRTETLLTVSAKKNGKVVAESEVNPYALSSYIRPGYSYDGTTEANDGTMTFDLNNVIENINSNNLTDYDWYVTVNDENYDSSTLTVKDIRIVDSNTGKSYAMNAEQNFKLNGDTKVVNISFPNQQYSASIQVDPDDNVGLYEEVTFTANVVGGKAPYQYRYTYTKDGQDYVVSDYSSNQSFKKAFTETGCYNVKVQVKDAEGRVVTGSKVVTVHTPEAAEINPSVSIASVGESVKFTPVFKYFPSEFNVTNLKYTATKNGKTETIPFTYDYEKSATWKPTENGTYQIKLEIVKDSKVLSSKTIEYTVGIPENSVTIYYKGYSTPYIHYQVGSGSWTSVPGVAMTQTNEASGYTHKYIIDLGSASYANVCFNDGNGSWDSRNGANYYFTKGTYSFSNGSINNYVVEPEPEPTPLAASIAITPTVNIGVYEQVDIKAAATGGKAPYQYRYTYTRYGQTYVIADYSSNASIKKELPEMGPYAIEVTVRDANGNTAKASATATANTTYIMALNTDKANVKAGETVKITPETLNLASVMTYDKFQYTATKDGKTQTITTNSDKTADWTPSEAGTYQLKLEIVYKSKSIASRTLNYTVEQAPENQITIYYKGYSTPYIHYQVGNGSWTSVPGVAMTQTNEVSGYTHKYTINLGSASYANVCFNDGNGNWDSRNGTNYYFAKGTYTYSNGNITKR